MQREITAIVGRTGQGKTLWGRAYARSHSRVFAYDPMEAYDDVIYLYDEESVLIRADNETFSSQRSFRYGITDPTMLDLFGSLCYLSFGSLFVLEEFSTIHSRGMLMPPWLRRFVFMGRHRHLSLLLVAQRAASIPIDIRSQINRIVTFAQHEPEDIDWLKVFFSKEQLRAVPDLPPLHCLDSGNGRAAVYPIHNLVQRRLGLKLPVIPVANEIDNDSHVD